VAVLTDSLTASSGEAVAVAFRGRPNARSFGWPTTGVSSANRTVFLPDGARLYVTASVYADRTGRTYGGSLVPDVMIEDVMAADTTTASGADALHGDAARRPYAAARDTLPATTLDPPHDPAALRLFDAATAWLAAHPACDTTATAPTAFVPVTFTSAPPASMSDAAASAAAAPSASSVLGLRTTIYTVPDLEAAKAWYAQAFGVAPYFDEPFYVGFDVGGYELGLSPAEDGKRPGGTGVVAYWGVDDVEAAHAHFLEHGAAPREDVMDVGDGVRVAVVADPYGNLIGLIENPHFGK
jgi:predicted enzyme related to lactoylglutathione lyase